MKIIAENIYKRYIAKYIIKDFSCLINSGECYGISGPNGSGKSTLIQILSGFLSPSKGTLQFFNSDGSEISRNDVYAQIAIVAPYIELDMELTPAEIFNHLKNFKNYEFDSVDKLLSLSNLSGSANKQLKHFSSGMTQRFELGLAMLSDADLLLLDEPTSFLDAESKQWWVDLLNEFTKEKTVLIASNDQFDLNQTSQIISLGELVNPL